MLVRNEQQRRNERARRNFLDRSLRDARPTPPTVVPPPTTAAGEVQVINTAVPVITIQTDTTATAQTPAVSHTEAANIEPPPPSTAP
eukprot:5292085-Amphidinium_carterae.1